MNPSVSNYKRDKDKKLIGEIFSVADEAFGLVMLYNEYDVWAGDTTTVTKENGQKKKFLDSKSGRKDGWTAEGKNLFYEWCEEVNMLREQPETSKQLELQIQNRLLGKIRAEDTSEGIRTSVKGSMDKMETTKPFRSKYLQNKMMERKKAIEEEIIQIQEI